MSALVPSTLSTRRQGLCSRGWREMDNAPWDLILTQISGVGGDIFSGHFIFLTDSGFFLADIRYFSGQF